MADGQGKPGTGKQTPYPANWGKMTAGQKREWAAKNRPSQPATPRPTDTPKPAPAPVATATPPEGEYPTDRPAESAGEAQDEYAEESNDTVQVSIKVPGQDVTEMSGKEVLAAILRALAEQLSGQAADY